MKKLSIKSILILAICMVLMLIMQISVYAQDYTGHWAENIIDNWIIEGYLFGNKSGEIKPNDSITRAEFVTLINRVLKSNEKADITFKDVSTDKWYYQEIQKAMSLGYINGYDKYTFKPESLITREEAVSILVKIMYLDSQETPSLNLEFKDKEQISQWSKQYLVHAIDKRIINGYNDNTLRPKANLTRAEAIKIIEYATKLDIVVSKDNTIIKDRTLRSNLIISEKLEENNATLENIKTTHDIIINGGGENSIYLRDVEIKGNLIINKKNGKLRIKVDGKTFVENLNIKSGVNIEQSDLNNYIFNKLKIEFDSNSEGSINLNCKFKELISENDIEIISFNKKVSLTKNMHYVGELLKKLFGWSDKENSKPNDKNDDDDFEFAEGYPYISISKNGFYEIKVKLEQNGEIYIVQGINDKKNPAINDIMHGHRAYAVDGFYRYEKATANNELTVTTDWLISQPEIPEVGFYVLAKSKSGEIETKYLKINSSANKEKDMTSPTPLDAYINNDGTKITITFNEALDQNIPIRKEAFKNLDIKSIEIVNKNDEYGHINSSAIVIYLSTAIKTDIIQINYEKPSQNGIIDKSIFKNQVESFQLNAKKANPKVNFLSFNKYGEIFVIFDQYVNIFEDFTSLDSNTIQLLTNDGQSIKINSFEPIEYHLYKGYKKFKITCEPIQAQSLFLNYTVNDDNVKAIYSNAGDKLKSFSKEVIVDKISPQAGKMNITSPNTIQIKFSENLMEQNLLPCSFEIKINNEQIEPARTLVNINKNIIEIQIKNIEISQTDKIQLTYNPKHSSNNAILKDEAGNNAIKFTIDNNGGK